MLLRPAKDVRMEVIPLLLGLLEFLYWNAVRIGIGILAYAGDLLGGFHPGRS
jgi:hypothetical protein